MGDGNGNENENEIGNETKMRKTNLEDKKGDNRCAISSPRQSLTVIKCSSLSALSSKPATTSSTSSTSTPPSEEAFTVVSSPRASSSSRGDDGSNATVPVVNNPCHRKWYKGKKDSV